MERPSSRTTIYISLLCCLLIPMICVSSYGANVGVKGIILMALPSLIFGATGLWFLLQLWEKKMHLGVTQFIRAKMDKIQESNHTLELEDLRQEYHQEREELMRQKEEAQRNLQKREALLSEYQKTISEQRAILEKKGRHIEHLEGRVRALCLEIRNLLQLETSSPGLNVNEQAMIDSFLLSSSSPHKTYDFSIQLQKYIDKAENLTGVDHLGYIGGRSPRFLDLSLECYAIDRRRLLESFKDESAHIIYLYSPLEKKFLFVNWAVKSLTGWGREKFMKEFPRLVVQGYLDWEEALFKLKTAKECFTKLVIVNKTGELKPFECFMGVLSRGPFINHVLGLLNRSNR
jgi:PAS domain-containing protein